MGIVILSGALLAVTAASTTISAASLRSPTLQAAKNYHTALGDFSVQFPGKPRISGPSVDLVSVNGFHGKAMPVMWFKGNVPYRTAQVSLAHLTAKEEARILMRLPRTARTYGRVHLAVTLPSHEIIGQTGVCASVTVVTPTHVYQLYEWMNTFREDFQFMASFSAPGVKHLSSYRGWLLCPAKSLYPACRR